MTTIHRWEWRKLKMHLSPGFYKDMCHLSVDNAGYPNTHAYNIVKDRGEDVIMRTEGLGPKYPMSLAKRERSAFTRGVLDVADAYVKLYAATEMGRPDLLDKPVKERGYR